MKKGKLIRYASILLFILFCVESAQLYAAEMKNYCIVPPYVKRDVPPNIMILMDNSDDMFNEAFGDGLPAYNAATDAYNDNAAWTYIGYFKPNVKYKYTGQKFEEGTNTDLYLGNLMNWATMSRFDILQKVLLGGRSASRQSNAHTLGSLSGTWEKTWGNCKFSISSNNVIISDSGGTCDLSAGGETTCPTPTGNCATDPLFPCSTGSGHASKAPSITAPSSPNLPDATKDTCYSFTFRAKWGKPTPTATYTWTVTAGSSLPPGLQLDASSGQIYNAPTSTGTFSFTITVTDAIGQTDSKTVNLKVLASTGVRQRQMNVRVDLPEEPLTDLNGNDIWDPGETYTDTNGNGQWDGKKGVIQEFWDENNPRARWGMTDFFGSGARIDVETCIPASPASSFYTAIQNATPAPLSPIAKGFFGVTHYFINSTSGRPEYDSNAYFGCTNKDPLDATPCRLNFILMITSGTNVSGPQLPTGTTTCAGATAGDCIKANAAWAFNNDLRNDRDGKQYISTYIVNTFGYEANKATLRQAAEENGGGKYYDADESNLEAKLREALQDILRRAASGTAASVLASGEGSGANLIQAVFYPRSPKIQAGGIFDREVSWIGRLTNYWYYVDPFFTSSSILDDSGGGTPDQVLDLSNDKVIKLRFDPSAESTMADRYSFGSITLIDTIPLENVKSLWEAGLELWKRTSARSIKTTIGGSLIDFSTTNASILRPYLDPGDINGDTVVNDADATRLIEYIHGQDFSNLRSRTVAVDLNGDGVISGAEESAKVWKLGDVLNSTPKISSWIQLNTYDQVYGDTSYSEFLKSDKNKNRGMVFAGGNDGMLHAFKLGKLELKWTGQGTSEKARVTGTGLGEDVWAFIPKNALPYLKYFADPGYCHVYTVDLAPYIFDASIGGDPDVTRTENSWRTILIGGMRFGGACRNKGVACNDGTTNCVNTPVANLGYSSYFALDITDQNNPTLLWEFSDPTLGFTTTGPAVVRISARTDGNPDRTKNGHWFVVFGSGPTGPIDITQQQFLGRSDQNLRLFILDLKTGTLLRTIDTGIQYAFAGSMLNSTMDSDLDYQDDAAYIGYVKRTGTSPNFAWTDGGVGRLVTKENIDPANWTWSRVMDGIGPVTSSIVHLQKKNKGILWLFFGTGRYYYEKLTTVDDETGRRQLFGIKEPCFSSSGFNLDCSDSDQRSFCTTPVTSSTCGDLTNVTDISDVPSESTANSASFYGWYINLDPSGGAYRAERVITDPLATTSGLVFFTTYIPYSDVCSYGGKSFIWAVRYTTGGAAGALLKGKALLQVSTGSIEQLDLSTTFTEAGGRKTSALEGVPPTAQGLSLLSTPPPVKRVLHMRER